MPITFEIDRSKDLTIFTMTGDVTHAEIGNALNSYASAGPTHYELYDFSNGTGKTVTFKQIKEMIDKEASRSSRKRWKMAIVVFRDIGFSMARILQGMTEVEKTPQTAKVFRSLEEAYKWLNLPQGESGGRQSHAD